MTAAHCELCELAAPAAGTSFAGSSFAGSSFAGSSFAGSSFVYRDNKLSVIIVDDADYPGFCRVIWNDHVKEMSDLAPAERQLLHEAVYRVEVALREVLAPTKVNVASLGNAVPHLHWHVIPRFAGDAHFPSPVWAEPVRRSDATALAARRALLPQLAAAIERRMSKQ